MSGSRRELWVGALAGYVASRTMDAATGWFYSRQSEASRRREQELAPGGGLRQLGLQLGGAAGRELSDGQAERLGVSVHRSLGVTYGIVASALALRGVRPLAAGLAPATAGWLLLDEGASISQFSDYPVASHLRGVVGHGTHGLVTAAILALVVTD